MYRMLITCMCALVVQGYPGPIWRTATGKLLFCARWKLAVAPVFPATQRMHSISETCCVVPKAAGPPELRQLALCTNAAAWCTCSFAGSAAWDKRRTDR